MGGPGLLCLSSKSSDSQCHKILSHDCRRISDSLSSKIPLCLPHRANLLTQPFNRSLHRYFIHLSCHACLPKPQASESRDSLVKWQNELRLLKDAQPEQSMKQTGLFCSVVQIESGGVQGTIYKPDSSLPAVPFPGKETLATHHRWLLIKLIRGATVAEW